MVITTNKTEATYVAFPTHSRDRWIIAKLDDDFRNLVRCTQVPDEEISMVQQGPAISLTDRLFDPEIGLAYHPYIDDELVYIKASDWDMMPFFQSFNLALCRTADLDFVDGFVKLLTGTVVIGDDPQYGLSGLNDDQALLLAIRFGIVVFESCEIAVDWIL